jgi:hypothetical protein
MSATKNTPVTPASSKPVHPPLFGIQNYILFAVGALLIVIGFILMSGGASQDPNVFNPEVFNSTRITTAPILVLLGFAVTGVGIMRRSKN